MQEVVTTELGVAELPPSGPSTSAEAEAGTQGEGPGCGVQSRPVAEVGLGLPPLCRLQGKRQGGQDLSRRVTAAHPGGRLATGEYCLHYLFRSKAIMENKESRHNFIKMNEPMLLFINSHTPTAFT